MEDNEVQRYSEEMVQDIQSIINTAKNNAIRSADFERVRMYWKIGERIVVEEQKNEKRAEYGTRLIVNLGKVLTKEYGSGFSERILRLAR